MAYVVDRVVICDAFREPDAHYELLPGGRSKRVASRRPSMRFQASARDAKGGIAGVVGKEGLLFDDLSSSGAELNDFVNWLRDEVRAWRTAGCPGTAGVTRRLLEWWFERDEERRAVGRRFFFCQQEAVETVIYLYEVQNRRKLPETGDLLRYALELATGTRKTVVMALFVTWATLHKCKVSGSSLLANFLVLVPNLTVRDRVSGQPRGDGLDPAGEQNLYDASEMVNTVGSKGKPGEHVRAIVSVNMLSEGWDVKSVTHILGLRALGSTLLTEQIIGRGLRRTNYDVLNQPLEERPGGSEETVDAFGIPFVGFSVEKRKRSKTGDWGRKPVWIEPNPKKARFRVQVPNDG